MPSPTAKLKSDKVWFRNHHMNDVPRQKLREIVSQRNILDDPRLCEALLRDLCGEHKREIFVLVAALKERVAADLAA